MALTTLVANAALKGDVNGDGEVGIADVNTLVDMILTDDILMSGDVNGDGEIGMPDIMCITQYILNGKFPDEKSRFPSGAEQE